MHRKSLATFVLPLLASACGAGSSPNNGSGPSTGGTSSQATGGSTASMTGGSSSTASGGAITTSGGSSTSQGGAMSSTGGLTSTSGGTSSTQTGGQATNTSGGATSSTGGNGGTAMGGSVTSTSGGMAAATGGKASTASGGKAGGGTASGGTSGGMTSVGQGGGPAPDGKADSSLIGFAAHAALGLKTTTGGDGGTVVTVTTLADLIKYASADEPYVIQVQGTITTSDAKYLKLQVKSNKTIVGLGSDATVEHIGFDVTGWWDTQASTIADFCEAEYKDQFTPVSNVIIRNLHFKNTLGNSSDADGIVVQCYSHHVWVDHNTFHGVASGNDGAIDVKRGADWVTVSWNHISAWDKAMLLGHVDSNEAQDSGTLHVTYHHNFFENTRQRHPRVRFAHAHIFNNYLFNDASVPNRTASYFLVAGVEANIHADANLVEHSKEIYLVGEESDSGAKLTYTDTNQTVALTAGAEAVFHVQPNGTAFKPTDFYSYTPDPAAGLAAIVRAGAGAGKL